MDIKTLKSQYLTNLNNMSDEQFLALLRLSCHMANYQETESREADISAFFRLLNKDIRTSFSCNVCGASAVSECNEGADDEELCIREFLNHFGMSGDCRLIRSWGGELK